MHRMLESLKIASPVRKRNCSTRSHSAGTTLDCYGSKPGPAPGADTKCARIGGQKRVLISFTIESINTDVSETRTTTGRRIQLLLAHFDLNQSVGKPLLRHLKLNARDKNSVFSKTFSFLYVIIFYLISPYFILFYYHFYGVNQFTLHSSAIAQIFLPHIYNHVPLCNFSLYLKKAGLASRNIVY